MTFPLSTLPLPLLFCSRLVSSFLFELMKHPTKMKAARNEKEVQKCLENAMNMKVHEITSICMCVCVRVYVRAHSPDDCIRPMSVSNKAIIINCINYPFHHFELKFKCCFNASFILSTVLSLCVSYLQGQETFAPGSMVRILPPCRHAP